MLDGGGPPTCRVLGGNVDDLLGLLFVGARHLAHQHIAFLRTVEIAHMVVVEHKGGAYLRGQQIPWLPLAPRLLGGDGFLAVGLPFRKDFLHPFLVAEAVEVGVWFIEHLVAWLLSLIRLVAVLRAGGDMADAVFHVVGIDKLLFEFFPFLGAGLEREGMGEEIVGSGVLVHSAH